MGYLLTEIELMTIPTLVNLLIANTEEKDQEATQEDIDGFF